MTAVTTVTVATAQCGCGSVPVALGFPIRKCGSCGTTPVVIRALGTETMRVA